MFSLLSSAASYFSGTTLVREESPPDHDLPGTPIGVGETVPINQKEELSHGVMAQQHDQDSHISDAASSPLPAGVHEESSSPILPIVPTVPIIPSVPQGSERLPADRLSERHSEVRSNHSQEDRAGDNSRESSIIAPDNADNDARSDTAIDERTFLDKADGHKHGAQKISCGCSEEGRNLVVCIDGTSNEFGEKNTNVIELYSLIPKGEADKQCTYYNSGIGTYAGPSRRSLSKVIGTKLDLAIAWNFESIVLDAYRWLSETYKDGDRIFLFGFSRGAYQVRVLSAMIHKVGLIDRGNEKQIPFAYKWYLNPERPEEAKRPCVDIANEPMNAAVRSSATLDSVLPSRIHTAKRFKEVFSRNVPVHFVGAWDTVSSVGIVRGRKLLPGTAEGMDHVCYFRHALALDERRVKFLPEYACGGTGPLPSTTEAQTKSSDTKEVWFAGTHSDVGGGNAKNEGLDSARPALRWMYAEASFAGLRFDRFTRKTKVSDGGDIEVNESLTGPWWLLEYLPLRRLSYITKENSNGKDTCRRLHRGGARVIQNGQKIHPSVWLAENLVTKYTPRAQLQDMPDAKMSEIEAYYRRMEFWRTLKGRDDLGADGTSSNPWKEVDIYEVMAHFVLQYTNNKTGTQEDSDKLLSTMRDHASSGEGWRALSRELQQLLNEQKAIPTASLCGILRVLMTSWDALSKSSDAKSADARPKELVGSYRTVRAQMLQHFGPDENAKETKNQKRIARRFLIEFTETAQVCETYYNPVDAVAFSPDSKHVVASTFYDSAVRVWDVKTGKIVGKWMTGHTKPVRSVAFSPDGKRIVSGSDDHTIRIWDAETRAMEGNPLDKHDGPVTFVAFSSDNTRIFSGGLDKKVRIWDAETGQRQAGTKTLLKDDKRTIVCVAFSPDGKRVGAGSQDGMIQTWDMEYLKMVKEFRADSQRCPVGCIAFSRDNKRIVSGLADGTLRIWNTDTGQSIGQPLKGHSDTVCDVAFSQDGRRVVSGSRDYTVRIWDAIRYKPMGKPYEGHHGSVNCVAFSPDGKCIASGSNDATLRVWDVIHEPL